MDEFCFWPAEAEIVCAGCGQRHRVKVMLFHGAFPGCFKEPSTGQWYRRADGEDAGQGDGRSIPVYRPAERHIFEPLLEDAGLLEGKVQ